jgi:5-methyltetrahydrofolate--homocysteine methyltransferase
MTVRDIFNAVLGFDKELVVENVHKELSHGTSVSVILKEGLIAPLDEIGQKFTAGEIFLPEMLAAAQAMRGGLDLIRPQLAGVHDLVAGKVVIGTVKGDLHDIGKDLVAMMLEGAGFAVVNLGVDVEPEAFLQSAKEQQADIVALSALLTTTMPAMQATLKRLKSADIKAKVLVGGAPVNQSFADQIGADGYADDAPSAVVLAKRLLGK